MSEPSLDELFSDDFKHEDLPEEPQGEAEAEPQEAEAPQEEAPQEPEPTKAEEPPSSEAQEAEDRMIPLAAHLDEREKRQKLERELEELRRQQTPQEPKQRIDPVEDPDGYQDQMEAQLRQATFQMERRLMAKFHPDWKEAEAWINQELGSNAALATKLQNSDSMLEDAYNLYQNHKRLEELESVAPLAQENEALKARIAELEAGATEKAEVDQAVEEAKDAAIEKPSLANTGNSTGRVDSEGMLSLEDLMGSDFNHRPN